MKCNKMILPSFQIFLLSHIADNVCLVLYSEYVKHPLLQNRYFFYFILRNQQTQTRAKVYFFMNNCKENEGLSLQMEMQRKQDHSNVLSKTDTP